MATAMPEASVDIPSSRRKSQSHIRALDEDLAEVRKLSQKCENEARRILGQPSR